MSSRHVGGRLRVDFDEMVDVPLLDEVSGAYVDVDQLPLSPTTKVTLCGLQRRWSAANEQWFAGAEDVDDDGFWSDVRDVELHLRRELAGTPWSLVRTGGRRG